MKHGLLIYNRTSLKLKGKRWNGSAVSPPQMLNQIILTARKVIIVFWGRQGISLIHFLQRGETINKDGYCETLKEPDQAPNDVFSV